MTKIKGKKQ